MTKGRAPLAQSAPRGIRKGWRKNQADQAAEPEAGGQDDEHERGMRLHGVREEPQLSCLGTGVDTAVQTEDLLLTNAEHMAALPPDPPGTPNVAA
jgi:hypothetical protein